MGHASSIALGIAIEKTDRNIYCFDGDGAFLMHQGALTINASKTLNNFKHIVFNNEAHDSVGSQPTANSTANLSQIALNSGYKKVYSVKSKEELEKILPEFINSKATVLLEIKVKCGARENLGRPKEKPVENKEIFMQNLTQIDFCYRGAIENLSKILELEKAKKVLVFTGKNSYKLIKPIIEEQLKNIEYSYYNNFSTNPKIEEIEQAINRINKNFDLIIAIGGGSVIDFAKVYKYNTNSSKLIAIPTTCGTGSEATQFAVYYEDGKKYSLDDNSVLPNYAIIDCQFMENNPKYLKACTALDAYCQAIESYWAVKSTPISREYARQAIEICKDNIVNYVNTNDSIYAEKMAQASNLAGKAINISRTTAAHVMSYAITSKYGIPHGHAVALTISKLYELNLNTDNTNIVDPRGLEFFDEIRDRLDRFFPCSFAVHFNSLLKEIDIESKISEFKSINFEDIVTSVNQERLRNNPRILYKKDLFCMLGVELDT